MPIAYSPAEVAALKAKKVEELSLAETVFLQGLKLKELEERILRFEVAIGID